MTSSALRERSVEAHLVRSIKAAGGECYKWASPGARGVPDRLVVLPHGRVIAVECKAPGKRPTKLQQHALAKLRALGVDATWVDSIESVDALVDTLVDALEIKQAIE